MGKIDISYQNYDIAFKDAFSIFQDKSLEFLGIDLPKIIQVLDSKMPVIAAKEERFDMVFRLEDNSILHLEEEVNISFEDLQRFAAYDLHLYNQYRTIIHTIVITRGVSGKQVSCFDSGVMQYRINVFNLANQDGDRKYEEIIQDIANDKNINPLELVFMPLMSSSAEPKVRVKRLVNAVLKIPAEKSFKRRLIVSILVMSDKLLEEDLLKEIWEDATMYKFIEFAERNGIDKGVHQGQERALLRLLVRKFPLLPERYIEAVKKLNSIQLEIILDDIFELEKLSDLDKYLGFSQEK